MSRIAVWLAAASWAFAALGTAGPAHGAPLAYQESVSGDLPTFAAGPPLALDIGANTVNGRVTFGIGGDFDSFKLSLSTGMTLTSIEVAFAVTKVGVATPAVFIQISDDQGPWFVFPDFLFDFGRDSQTSPVAVVSSHLPVTGPNTLTIENDAALCECRPGNGYFVDYTWTFTVDAAAIPEPAAIMLLGSSLLGMALARRRTASRSDTVRHQPHQSEAG